MNQIDSRRFSWAQVPPSPKSIRGVSPYVDSSGRKTTLPHYLGEGQTYQSGGNVYAQDAQGTYYRQQNNGWVRMDAAQR